MWFKLKCFYYAQAELYDRTLTDLRSPYDETEALLVGGEQRSLSNNNARMLYAYISREADKLRIPYDVRKNMRLGKNWTAQHWIDEYNRLIENGEMNFINGE